MAKCFTGFHKWRVIWVYENRFVERCDKCGTEKVTMGRPGY